MFWGPQGTFANGHEPQQLIEQMHAHNEQVKRTVPPERLLVWEVTEGWEPLCEFLGVDVPDEPLPHANDRGDVPRPRDRRGARPRCGMARAARRGVRVSAASGVAAGGRARPASARTA